VSERRPVFQRLLLASALPFGLTVVGVNFASALGASESFKDALVVAGLVGLLVALSVVAWKAYQERQKS
jgi:uncharacterized protein (DUF1501 family)